jgi:L-alanine-DL-glutamate epimerase-like enolase superfamily enzyme
MTTPVDRVDVSAFTIPTEVPESDGTLAWDKTTLVLVEAHAGRRSGIGYSYADAATSQLVRDTLGPAVIGVDAMAPTEAWRLMVAAVRNLGHTGIAAMAVAAVDTALWDLKARLLSLPLATLFGVVQAAVPVYGSGGFTSYDERQLAAQLAGWVEQGIGRVKMKVGREPDRDPGRVRRARRAIGAAAELYVDANGAYSRKQALAMAAAFADEGVSWFEEPVSSDDLDGLRLLRDRAPAGMEVSAGEYGYDAVYFRRMLAAGAVDVLQADASRCAGYTGLFQAAALSQAFGVPLSTHTAPMLHLPAACALQPLRHVEWFFDHVRIERMAFDGFIEPVGGMLRPDRSRMGNGLAFRHKEMERYAVG